MQPVTLRCLCAPHSPFFTQGKAYQATRTPSGDFTIRNDCGVAEVIRSTTMMALIYADGHKVEATQFAHFKLEGSN